MVNVEAGKAARWEEAFQAGGFAEVFAFSAR